MKYLALAMVYVFLAVHIFGTIISVWYHDINSAIIAGSTAMMFATLLIPLHVMEEAP